MQIVVAVLTLAHVVFVLIVQSFQKIPALKAVAPTQKEPPFAIAQGVVLMLFVIAGVAATLRFRPAPALNRSPEFAPTAT